MPLFRGGGLEEDRRRSSGRSAGELGRGKEQNKQRSDERVMVEKVKWSKRKSEGQTKKVRMRTGGLEEVRRI